MLHIKVMLCLPDSLLVPAVLHCIFTVIELELSQRHRRPSQSLQLRRAMRCCSRGVQHRGRGAGGGKHDAAG